MPNEGETNEDRFRNMWNWMSEYSMRKQIKTPKEYYFYFNKIQNAPYNLCYACEEALDRKGNSELFLCEFCPLDWHGIPDHYDWKPYCVRKESLYSKWMNCDSYEKSSMIEKCISEMEWKDVKSE